MTDLVGQHDLRGQVVKLCGDLESRENVLCVGQQRCIRFECYKLQSTHLRHAYHCDLSEQQSMNLQHPSGLCQIGMYV